MRLTFFPSLLAGEGGSNEQGEFETGEGFGLSIICNPSSGTDFVRATFSHKGRREGRLPPTLVIPRESGGSSTPRLHGSIAGVSGILDHPLSRVMTTVVVRIQFSNSDDIHNVIASQRVGAKRRPMTGSAKQSIAQQGKRGLLRRFAPRNDGRDFASPRRNAPELCRIRFALPTEGAGNAGCQAHPQPRVRWVVVVCTRVFTARSPGLCLRICRKERQPYRARKDRSV